MFSLLLLTSGSICLAIAATIFMWPVVRVAMLQNDFATMRLHVLESRNSFSELEFDKLNEMLSIATDNANKITFSFVAAQFVNKIKGQDNVKKATVEHSDAYASTLTKFGTRFARFILFETFTGMLFLGVFVLLMGWSRVKRAILSGQDNSRHLTELLLLKPAKMF